jgi:hypothetical protein
MRALSSFGVGSVTNLSLLIMRLPPFSLFFVDFTICVRGG